MTLFRYTAVDAQGVCREGLFEAADEASARRELLAGGLSQVRLTPAPDATPCANPPSEEAPCEAGPPVVVSRVPEATPETPPASPPSPVALTKNEALDVTAGIATLMKTNLPLEAGLEAMAEDTFSRAVRRGCRAAASQLRSGRPLNEVMGFAERHLPPYVATAVRYGLTTGRVAEVVEQVGLVERRVRDANLRMWGILSYPLLLLAAFLAYYVVLSTVLMPMWAGVLRGFRTEIPALTRFAMAVCSPLAAWITTAVLGAVVLGAAAAFVARRRSEAIDRIWFTMPLFGAARYFTELAGFTRMLGLLVNLAVPLPTALRTAAACVRSRYLRTACETLAVRVEQGATLEYAIRENAFLPRRMQPFLAQGEAFGRLPQMLREVAVVFEEAADLRRTSMRLLVVPIALLCLVMGVGLVVMAMFLPMISQIQKLC